MSDGTAPPEDTRLDEIIELITRIASGDLLRRLSPSGKGDQLDVIITGLNMLAEELASSIESERELRATLENKVSQRTKELEEKVRIIAAQNQTILELSTPVLQIWKGILVLPLIGTITALRARQIIENLLESIKRTQASVVIMDITGVTEIDTAVANHFLKTIQAARILGSEVILTGISPTNAQTITRLGLNFEEILTKSSLYAGLKHALSLASFSLSTNRGSEET